jgi:hypothetical protein
MADSQQQPRLLDQVRTAIRVRHYSRRTEEAYAHWIRKFILYHGKRHPSLMREPEIGAFISALATEGRVSASTQNQALSAVVFLYREVLRVSAVKRLTDSGTDVRPFGNPSSNGLQKTLALSQFPYAACPAKRAEICRSVYYWLGASIALLSNAEGLGHLFGDSEPNVLCGATGVP